MSQTKLLTAAEVDEIIPGSWVDDEFQMTFLAGEIKALAHTLKHAMELHEKRRSKGHAAECDFVRRIAGKCDCGHIEACELLAQWRGDAYEQRLAGQDHSE